MKTPYEPDNTRSSIVILVSLGIIVSVIAAFIGLGDKPEVSAIFIAPPGSDQALADVGFGDTLSEDQDGTSPNLGDTDLSDTDLSDTDLSNPDLGDTNGSGLTQDDAGSTVESPATETTETETQTDGERQPQGEVIPVPTLEPTPTPEVAAAVEPTPAPETDATTEDAVDTIDPALALPTSPGVVQGSFFTRSDENDGAVVGQNLLTVSFTEEGDGEFQGVLEISYPDGTEILLNMSGPVTWAPTTPQVETDVVGAFTLNAPIDADDVMTDDAELVITSLANGSGSLCTSRCFGFTFTPPA